MLSRPILRTAFPHFSTKSTSFSTKMYCSQNVHYFFKVRSRFFRSFVVSYSRRQEVTKKILSFPYSLLMQNPLPGRQNRAADDAKTNHTAPPGMFPAVRKNGSFLCRHITGYRQKMTGRLCSSGHIFTVLCITV